VSSASPAETRRSRLLEQLDEGAGPRREAIVPLIFTSRLAAQVVTSR